MNVKHIARKRAKSVQPTWYVNVNMNGNVRLITVNDVRELPMRNNYWTKFLYRHMTSMLTYFLLVCCCHYVYIRMLDMLVTPSKIFSIKKQDAQEMDAMPNSESKDDYSGFHGRVQWSDSISRASKVVILYMCWNYWVTFFNRLGKKVKNILQILILVVMRVI